MSIHVLVIPVVIHCIIPGSCHGNEHSCIGYTSCIISGLCHVNEHSSIGYTGCYTRHYFRFMSGE